MRRCIRPCLLLLLTHLGCIGLCEEAGIGAIPVDDECSGDGDGLLACSVSALQHRAVVLRGDLAAEQSDPVLHNVARASVGSVAKASSFACELVPYHGSPSGPESCFCHKAENPTCIDKPCTCVEGCSDTAVTQGRQTVTFRNRAKAACAGAMLTIPRPYFTDIDNLKSACTNAADMLAEMLVNGYQAYEEARGGPAMQCIHKADHVSVHWLHLHTFCPGTTFEGMPNKATSFCAPMSDVSQAGSIAAEFLSWAR